VRSLPRLIAPGIVPCIISISKQLPCFLIVLEIYLKLRQDKFILRYIFYNEWFLPIFATSRNTQLSFNSQVSCHSLVNKDEMNNILCLYFCKKCHYF